MKYYSCDDISQTQYVEYIKLRLLLIKGNLCLISHSCRGSLIIKICSNKDNSFEKGEITSALVHKTNKKTLKLPFICNSESPETTSSR